MRTLAALLWGACAAPPVVTPPNTNSSGSTADTSSTGPTKTTPTDPGCVYPEGSGIEFEEGAPLASFGWKTAYHRDGRELPLFMNDVFCNERDDIDWSPFDVLVFVAIPAW